MSDTGIPFSESDTIDQIKRIAAESDLADVDWPDRGVAPAGYIKGMALVYVRVFCKLKNGDAAAIEMAKAQAADPARDALTWYGKNICRGRE